MTYLELLSWARKGISAEQAELQEMKERAADGMGSGVPGAKELYKGCMEKIEILDVKLVSIGDLEDIHNREYGG